MRNQGLTIMEITSLPVDILVRIVKIATGEYRHTVLALLELSEVSQVFNQACLQVRSAGMVLSSSPLCTMCFTLLSILPSG